jgi:hypothetical protein
MTSVGLGAFISNLLVKSVGDDGLIEQSMLGGDDAGDLRAAGDAARRMKAVPAAGAGPP